MSGENARAEPMPAGTCIARYTHGSPMKNAIKAMDTTATVRPTGIKERRGNSIPVRPKQIALGTNESPASSGEYPSPSCRYSATVNMNPPYDTIMATSAASDGSRPGDRKSRNGIKGEVEERCTSPNATTNNAQRTRRSRGPNSSATTNDNTASESRTSPGRSRRRYEGGSTTGSR